MDPDSLTITQANSRYEKPQLSFSSVEGGEGESTTYDITMRQLIYECQNRRLCNAGGIAMYQFGDRGPSTVALEKSVYGAGRQKS